MVKRSLKKDITNILYMSNKLSYKKGRQINKKKWKASIVKTSPRKAIINSLDSFGKKELSVLIPAKKILDSKAKNICIAVIGINAYCAACYLKKAYIFAILLKDILY